MGQSVWCISIKELRIEIYRTTISPFFMPENLNIQDFVSNNKILSLYL